MAAPLNGCVFGQCFTKNEAELAACFCPSLTITIEGGDEKIRCGHNDLLRPRGGGGATWFQLYPDVCVEK